MRTVASRAWAGATCREKGMRLLGTGHLAWVSLQAQGPSWPSTSKGVSVDQYLICHWRGCGVVAGWGVGILVACWTWRHLVVALRAGAGLSRSLAEKGGIGENWSVLYLQRQGAKRY